MKQEYNINELMKGVVPLPTKENEHIYGIIESARKEFELGVARQSNDLLQVLGKKTQNKKSTLIERVYSSDGKIHNETALPGIEFIFNRSNRSGVLNRVGSVGLPISFYLFMIVNEASHLYDPRLYHFAAYSTVCFTLLSVPMILGRSVDILDYLRPSSWKKKKNNQQYEKNVEMLRSKNINDFRQIIEPIELYQLSVNEASQHIQRRLEICDTNNPNNFIRARDDFMLKLETYLLGGNAVVHYQPGSSIGTPVRYL